MKRSGQPGTPLSFLPITPLSLIHSRFWGYWGMYSSHLHLPATRQSPQPSRWWDIGSKVRHTQRDSPPRRHNKTDDDHWCHSRKNHVTQHCDSPLIRYLFSSSIWVHLFTFYYSCTDAICFQVYTQIRLALSPHHCFPKALVQDVRVLKGISRVLGKDWQDSYFINRRNGLENPANCLCGLGK